jgi:hypothetical protein
MKKKIIYRKIPPHNLYRRHGSISCHQIPPDQRRASHSHSSMRLGYPKITSHPWIQKLHQRLVHLRVLQARNLQRMKCLLLPEPACPRHPHWSSLTHPCKPRLCRHLPSVTIRKYIPIGKMGRLMFRLIARASRISRAPVAQNVRPHDPARNERAIVFRAGKS